MLNFLRWWLGIEALQRRIKALEDELDDYTYEPEPHDCIGFSSECQYDEGESDNRGHVDGREAGK